MLPAPAQAPGPRPRPVGSEMPGSLLGRGLTLANPQGLPGGQHLGGNQHPPSPVIMALRRQEPLGQTHGSTSSGSCEDSLSVMATPMSVGTLGLTGAVANPERQSHGQGQAPCAQPSSPRPSPAQGLLLC